MELRPTTSRSWEGRRGRAEPSTLPPLPRGGKSGTYEPSPRLTTSRCADLGPRRSPHKQTTAQAVRRRHAPVRAIPIQSASRCSMHPTHQPEQRDARQHLGCDNHTCSLRCSPSPSRRCGVSSRRRRKRSSGKPPEQASESRRLRGLVREYIIGDAAASRPPTRRSATRTCPSTRRQAPCLGQGCRRSGDRVPR